jgi:transcriptional regulator with PAS, ATPase and Fis domain
MSLREIEKGIWRKLALRETGTIARAAKLLGIGHTSLGEWFARRRRKQT